MLDPTPLVIATQETRRLSQSARADAPVVATTWKNHNPRRNNK